MATRGIRINCRNHHSNLTVWLTLARTFACLYHSLCILFRGFGVQGRRLVRLDGDARSAFITTSQEEKKGLKGPRNGGIFDVARHLMRGSEDI